MGGLFSRPLGRPFSRPLGGLRAGGQGQDCSSGKRGESTHFVPSLVLRRVATQGLSEDDEGPLPHWEQAFIIE